MHDSCEDHDNLMVSIAGAVLAFPERGRLCVDTRFDLKVCMPAAVLPCSLLLEGTGNYHFCSILVWRQQAEGPQNRQATEALVAALEGLRASARRGWAVQISAQQPIMVWQPAQSYQIRNLVKMILRLHWQQELRGSGFEAVHDGQPQVM